MKKSFKIYLFLSVVTGLSIAVIDSQHNWNDAGITVFMILSTSALFGYFSFQKPWLFALTVSAWIPIWSIISSNNFSTLFAIVPGFIGAYSGYFLKKLIKADSV